MFPSYTNGLKNKDPLLWKPQVCLRAVTQTNLPRSLPPHRTSPLPHCQILNECCIHPDDHVFIYLFIFFLLCTLKMLINWGCCWMHLHTYHINTDKAIGAKRARRTAAVNSQPDLRQSWMATEPGNKCFFHGRHVGAWGETNQYGKLMLIKYWSSCLEGNWF